MKKTCILIFFLMSFVILTQPHYGYSEESNYEIVFWETIKDSKDPKLYQMYLDKYPDGTFAELAEILKSTYGGASTVENTAPAPQVPKPKPQRKPTQQRPVVKKSSLNLAIFPFKFYDDGHYMQGILVNDITRSAARNTCTEISHSYYEMDARHRVTNLKSGNTVSQARLSTRNLWQGISPNVETISELGNELGIDTVITGTLNIDNPWSDAYTIGYIRIFMIDVATKKIVKSRNRSNLGDARDHLPGIIQEAFKNYTSQFCN